MSVLEPIRRSPIKRWSPIRKEEVVFDRRSPIASRYSYGYSMSRVDAGTLCWLVYSMMDGTRAQEMIPVRAGMGYSSWATRSRIQSLVSLMKEKTPSLLPTFPSNHTLIKHLSPLKYLEAQRFHRSLKLSNHTTHSELGDIIEAYRVSLSRKLSKQHLKGAKVAIKRTQMELPLPLGRACCRILLRS